MPDLKTTDNKHNFLELLVKIVATKFPDYLELIDELKCLDDISGGKHINFWINISQFILID